MSDPNKIRPDKHRPDFSTEEDLEGHRHALVEGADEDTEGHRVRERNHPGINEEDDVEGHRVRERNHPGINEEDDVEGHRYVGSNIQPPRDADLGGTEH
jgi:hypothetical protein